MNELRKYYDDSIPGKNTWIVDRTIYLTKHGSQAYGTNRPDSDLDLRGVAIPPNEYFHGFLNHFEQLEQKGDPDLVIFDIRKFVALATECNPNVIEILFTDRKDQIGIDQTGQRLMDMRNMFLSRKARWTFAGYATGQLKRINTHRKWLLNPPTHKPTRAEFDLLEETLIPKDQLDAAFAQIKKREEAWDIDLGEVDYATRLALVNRIETVISEMVATDKFLLAAKSLGYDTHFLNILKNERAYKVASNEWLQFQDWVKTRNVTRSALEATHGFDTKHGMHLVRLLRMASEILTEGKVIVRRPDAKELLGIRNGDWSYDKLIGWAKDQNAALVDIEKNSPLPHDPPRVKIDQALCNIVEEYNLKKD